ncbi:HAAS signaling domain-containing protein [Nesterenkonia populi]
MTASAERVAAQYVEKLDQAMVGADLNERRETLNEIRGELDRLVDEGATAEEMRGHLKALGPVEDIAQAASPSEKPPTHFSPNSPWPGPLLAPC